jgi:hypothetical protein
MTVPHLHGCALPSWLSCPVAGAVLYTQWLGEVLLVLSRLFIIKNKFALSEPFFMILKGQVYFQPKDCSRQ